MSGDSRVRQLVEEILDTGNSPEEVSRHFPELLPQVRERLRRLRTLQAEIGALFPDAGSTHGPGVTPTAPPTVQPPQIPGYDVQAVLGRGGMGVVFKARHLRLNRPVALKMLLMGACATPAERERFLREAEAAASLVHPNIVQVHDVGDHDGRLYFTMEFVEGGSLAEKLAGAPQPARETAELLAVLAEAVHVAHEGGVVHRDLKPSNVLLTADGTPKISDFGLARRVEDAAGLSLSGSPLGTPSYMAPEQAQGKSRSVGPAADIYALGAILYELLTGRPPFRAESSAETVQQVITQEPVPPSRLNAKIPADLETICLKCLQKDPARRYATAAALAEDLRRFLRAEPIAARPIRWSERSVRWVRRHPTAAALVVTALALLGLAAFAGVREWALAAERQAEMEKWADRLEYVIGLQREGRFAEARAILGRVPDAGSAELRAQIEQALAELDLAEQLDAIRLNRAALVKGQFDERVNKAKADQDYAAAFSAADLGGTDDKPDHAASRVRASSIRRALVAALDDWSICAGDPSRRTWILEVARQADLDATDWRKQVRDPASWNDASKLIELARTAPIEEESLQLLVGVGERLRAAGADAIPLLKRAQQNQPGDFWTNFALAEALREANDPGEAIRFYQAALAIRRDTAVVYNNLGVSLAQCGRTDEAIEHLQRALAIDPTFAIARSNLGNGFAIKGLFAEAIEQHLRALRVHPGSASAHSNLGVALADAGRIEEAIDHYRQALTIDPNYADAHSNLGNVLNKTGQTEEAFEHLRRALQLAPRNAHVHHNLGYAFYLNRSLDDAIEHYRQAIAIDDRFALAHSNLGIALAEAGRTNEAIEHFQQALRIDPEHAEAHTNFGIALTDQGRLDEAIEHLQQALRSNPDLAHAHGALGQTLLAVGRFQEATAATRRLVELLPSDHPHHTSAVQQLEYCEHMLNLESRLSDVLRGRHNPASAAECLEYAAICHSKKQYAAAARISAEAFAAQPQLADGVRTPHRYNAACCAALAVRGEGVDAGQLSDEARSILRRQAIAWLRADLTAWTRRLETGRDEDRQLVEQTLQKWRSDADVASIRDAEHLATLSASDQQACRQLWTSVSALSQQVHAVSEPLDAR